MKNSTLIRDCRDGGLKDVYLVSKFTSQKFIWINKIPDTKNSHLWIAVADNILRDFERTNVSHANLSMAPSKLNSLKNIIVSHKKIH